MVFLLDNNWLFLSISIVFPTRTFTMSADSEKEMQEWIDLLKWKMVLLTLLSVPKLHITDAL